MVMTGGWCNWHCFTQHPPKRFNRLTHQSTKDIGPAVGMTIPLTLAATQNT